MWNRRRKKFLRGLALGLAVAAVAAPTASARLADEPGGLAGTTTQVVRPDDRAGARGPGAAVVTEQVTRPDDRAVRVTPVSTVEPAVRPDDRAGKRGPGSVPATPTVVTAEPGGFDWTDAGIGAGIALGLILLGGGALLVARRHRKPEVAAF